MLTLDLRFISQAPNFTLSRHQEIGTWKKIFDVQIKLYKTSECIF